MSGKTFPALGKEDYISFIPESITLMIQIDYLYY